MGSNLDDATPFNLDLNHVLGKMPQKVFHTNRKTIEIYPFNYPYADSVSNNYATAVFNCLVRVLRLTIVG
jgi:hypothetical protein